MENNRQKIAVVALAALLVVGAIGVTIAYFTSETIFKNEFKTPAHESEFTEEFSSPENWLPGDEEKKEVSVKNTGEYDIAVRISYTEEWIGADGTTQLPLVQDQDGTEVRAAIINFPNKDDWGKRTEDDGVTYYYYKDILGKDESTSLFMDKVTFNKDIKHDEVCTNVYTYRDGTTSTGTTSEEGKIVTSTTKRCESTGQTYAGGTYILTIKIETIQWDQYKNGWGLDEDLEDLEWDTTLNDVMKKQSVLDNDIDFVKVSSATNGRGVYTYSGTENDEYPIYYYRGSVDNNVIFADFCWKIVRTTETGGIKLLYNGKIGVGNSCNNNKEESVIGNSAFNAKKDVVKYMGYMYDTNTSSTIKDYIDDWYEKNLLDNYDNYLEDTIWCNDISGKTANYQNYYHGFGIRSFIQKSKPIVSCPNKINSYTTKDGDNLNGNKLLDYPVALLTGDEAQLAGAAWYEYNNGINGFDSYLYIHMNFWSMSAGISPATSSLAAAEMGNIVINGNGDLNTRVLTGSIGVRPAISLKNGAKIASGNGTTKNPYIVES